MNISIPALLLTIGVCVSGLPSAQAAPATLEVRPPGANAPLVMGYYPSYRSIPALGELRADRFTHLLYSFVTADENGAIEPASYAQAPALVKAGHAKGIKVLLTLCGGANGAEFSAMARDDVKRAQFVADVTAAMKAMGADGLALDWEHPEPTDIELVTRFVGELRAATQAADPDAVLILVANANDYNGRSYDGAALRDLVDYVHVMTYDFHGPWSHAGHHAPLFGTDADPIDGHALNFETALKYWREEKGFPTDKILFGIAGYGRGSKVREWGETATAPSQYPEIAYADIMALIGQGWTRQWDAQAHAPWLMSDDKTDRISYDDLQSVADKGVWMKRQKLAGFFIWEVSQDYQNGDHALVARTLEAWRARARTAE